MKTAELTSQQDEGRSSYIGLRVVSRSIIFAWAIFAGSLTAAAQQVIRVPQSHALVMIDGNLEPGEWNDAARFSLGDKARVYVKQSGSYMYMAVEYISGDNFALDFYVQPADGLLYDLHSSAKLGERKLEGPGWSEEWKWWNNKGWVANWSRIDSFQERTLLPQRVREYQISRTRFAGRHWRIMFELLVPAKPEWQTLTYPQQARNTSTDHWLVLEF